MVESFWDRMQADLEPFWGVEAPEIRRLSARFPNILSIRRGKVDKFKLVEGYPEWLSRWKDMIEQLPAADLPDVDLAFNPDDEPHVFLSYETKQKLLKTASKERNLDAPTAEKPVFDNFEMLPDTPTGNRTWPGFWDGLKKGNSETWYFARAACPDDSPARRALKDPDDTTRPVFPDLGNQSYTSHGYVVNFTQSKSPCYNPSLRNTHGYFVYPKETTFLNVGQGENFGLWDSRQLTRIPFPLLSGCKVEEANGEILVPPAMNWKLKDEYKDFEFEASQALSWEEKEDKIMWRGVATGGFATKENWRRFPRYRLVSMLNATQVEIEADVLAGGDLDPEDDRRGADFPYPDVDLYQMTETSISSLAGWLRGITDAAFTLVPVGCWPPEAPATDCRFGESKYDTTKRIPFMDFFRNKLLPDVDGGSYSGRFRAYLLSNSVPIKATIWSEWHDSRLIPWHHFVPMDTGMGDLWGILDFFMGNGRSEEVKAERDAVGKAIATQGREWAERVLRKEDMEVWMFRLILEMARLGDERRLRMGYTGDLKSGRVSDDVAKPDANKSDATKPDVTKPGSGL